MDIFEALNDYRLKHEEVTQSMEKFTEALEVLYKYKAIDVQVGDVRIRERKPRKSRNNRESNPTIESV